VTDVVDAVLVAHRHSTKPVDVFNVATGDYITVREIAELACECLGLAPGKTHLSFGNGNRGWRGDVPVVRLATQRIRSLGWQCRRSTREALKASLMEMLPDLRAGRA
jgi:UDP-glucose 4-epimerase